MKRDVRRFLCASWRLLEVPDANPVRLPKVYRDVFGETLDVAESASGYHFAVDMGTRAYVLTKPARLAVPPPVVAQVQTLLAAKHRVQVRSSEGNDVPRRPSRRVPTLTDVREVELWPPPREVAEPIVVELASSPGFYLRVRELPTALDWTDTVAAATAFTDVSEAETALSRFAAQVPVILRYRASAIAVSDQIETEKIDYRS